MKFWIREVDLKAGGKEFKGSDFTIDFRVPFSTSKDPDISEVQIYNLSKDSISSIQSKAYVILNAGYKGNIGNILSGKIENIFTEWQGVDKITTLKISDGGLEWRNAKIQKTYQAGSTSKYIMSDLASMLGLEIAEINPKKDITYQLGKTVSGSIEQALKRLAQDTDSKMYIDKGRIYIRDGKKGTETGFLLNSDHGLTGSPEKIEEESEKGKKIVKYKVQSLLNHKISTDSIIQIQSKTVNGNYRVESGIHTGDFITEMVVVPM